MKIACISDMHTQYEKLDMPDADILVIAGDIEIFDRLSQLMRFGNWLVSLKKIYKYIIVIGGNHDFFLQRNPGISKELFEENGIIYLENSGITIEGIKFWGSPITPTFYDWAFMADRGKEIRRYWEMIPDNTDVLITHGPPRGIMDLVPHDGFHAGCDDLLNRVKEICPRLHIFGHIHDGYGIQKETFMHYHKPFETCSHECEETIFVNAAVLNEQYKLQNKPIVVEI